MAKKAASLKQESFQLESASRKTLAYSKIGDTLRKYRKERNMKLNELAALIGMSSSVLSKIENGRMIPTIPTLFSIINVLEVSLENFFLELTEQDGSRRYHLIRQSEYVPYVKEENVNGFDYYSILDHRIDSGSFQISLLHVSPRSRRSKVVTAAHEFIYLISGTIRYMLGDETLDMTTGDSLFFDGRIPHVPVNESKTMAIMLVIYFFTETSNDVEKKGRR